MKKTPLLYFLKQSNKKTMPKLVSGSGMVEILVAVFIFSVVLGSLITVSNTYLSGAEENLRSLKGAYLAEEGIEAVKIIRDTSWVTINNLSNNTDYYLYFDTSSSTNNTWKATSTASVTDLFFTRTFKLNSVNRDQSGRIVSSGGTLDTNSKKIIVSVSWQSKGLIINKILSAYIMNI